MRGGFSGVWACALGVLVVGCGDSTGADRGAATIPMPMPMAGTEDTGMQQSTGPDAGVDGSAADAAAGFDNADTCTAEQLAADCAGLECGVGTNCGMTCGSCDADLHCYAGECLTSTELCDVAGEMCECVSVEFDIMTYESCSMSLADGTEVDGEGFVQFEGDDYRVFAMDRWGDGHIMVVCDASLPPQLVEPINLYEYLAQMDNPRIGSFGRESICDPNFGVNSLPPEVQWMGLNLPPEYVADPSLLAKNWDLLVICGWKVTWDPAWEPIVQDFVAKDGKGLLVIMDYLGIEVMLHDYDAMNKILEPTGIVIDAIDLEWLPASGHVGLECVPDLTEDILD